MSHLNDPAVVRVQYASERNLQARAALWRELDGPDPREVLWEAIASAKPSRVIEVGGGEGWLAARVRDELGADVMMVDLSPRMVELAVARGVDARVGDVQGLSFADESFDLAIAAWMLYHVPDLDRGLSELARVLVPGGRLVANTNSSRHAEELLGLIGYPEAARRGTFNAENGEQSLRRHFSGVERIDVVAQATVRDRETLVAYRDSMSIDLRPVPDDVQLPFVVGSRGAVFVATR